MRGALGPPGYGGGGSLDILAECLNWQMGWSRELHSQLYRSTFTLMLLGKERFHLKSLENVPQPGCG